MESESNVCTTGESKDVDVVLGELLREAEAVLEAETNETAVEPALLDNAAADESAASDELPIESLPIADLPPELLPFISILTPQQKYFDFPESGDFFLKSTRPPNSNEISDLCISVPLSRLQLLALTTPDSSFVRIFNTFATPSPTRLPKPQTAVEKRASKPEASKIKVGPASDAKSISRPAQTKTKTSPPGAAVVKPGASALTSGSPTVPTPTAAVDQPVSSVAAVGHPDIRTSSGPHPVVQSNEHIFAANESQAAEEVGNISDDFVVEDAVSSDREEEEPETEHFDDNNEKGRNLPPDLFRQLKQFSKPFVSRRFGQHVKTYDDLPVDERSLAAAKEMIERWQRKNASDPAANSPDLLSEGLTCFRRLWTFNIHRFLDKRKRLQEKFAGGREPFRHEVIPPEEEPMEEQHVESIEDAEEDQRGRKLPPDLFRDLKEYSKPLVDRRFGPHVKAYQDLPIDQRSLAGAQEIIERWQAENSSEPAANAADFLEDSLAGFQRVWNMAINRLLSKRRNWQEKFGGRPEAFRPEGGGRGRGGGIPRPSYRGRDRGDFVRQPDRSTFEYSSPLAHTTHYPSINRYYPTAGAFPPPKAPGGRFSDLSDDEEDQQKSDLKYSRNWESEGPGSMGYYSRSDERPAKRSAPYERESWQGPRDYDSKRPRDFSPERYSDQGTVMRPRLDDINLSQFFSSPGDADLLKEMLHALKPNSSAGIGQSFLASGETNVGIDGTTVVNRRF